MRPLSNEELKGVVGGNSNISVADLKTTMYNLYETDIKSPVNEKIFRALQFDRLRVYVDNWGNALPGHPSETYGQYATKEVNAILANAHSLIVFNAVSILVSHRIP